jgi:hypothetical protein
VGGRTFAQRFNLSRNKSLRTLETTAESIGVASGITSDFLKTMLSSITPSVPLDVVIVYQDLEVCGMRGHILCRDLEPFRFCHSSQEKWNKDAWYYLWQLETFREIYKTRKFRLVLCADVPDFMAKYAVEILQRIVEAGKVMGGLFHLHEPLIISERRMPFTRYNDCAPGWTREWYVPASAL